MRGRELTPPFPSGPGTRPRGSPGGHLPIPFPVCFFLPGKSGAAAKPRGTTRCRSFLCRHHSLRQRGGTKRFSGSPSPEPRRGRDPPPAGWEQGRAATAPGTNRPQPSHTSAGETAPQRERLVAVRARWKPWGQSWPNSGTGTRASPECFHQGRSPCACHRGARGRARSPLAFPQISGRQSTPLPLPYFSHRMPPFLSCPAEAPRCGARWAATGPPGTTDYPVNSVLATG